MKDEKPTPLNPPLSGGTRSAPPLTRGGREGLGFLHYNNKLTEFARENRKNPTVAESKMWTKVLRMRYFVGYKFLRQKPIGSFIVDFYCSALRLAIEIDGDSHAEAIGYDVARTSALNSRGIMVVRYSNSDVLKNLEGVYDDLVCKVARISEGIVRP